MSTPISRAAAAAVLATAVGVVVESQLADPQPRRAPLTGALVLGGAALLQWSVDQLAGP